MPETGLYGGDQQQGGGEDLSLYFNDPEFARFIKGNPEPAPAGPPTSLLPPGYAGTGAPEFPHPERKPPVPPEPPGPGPAPGPPPAQGVPAANLSPTVGAGASLPPATTPPAAAPAPSAAAAPPGRPSVPSPGGPMPTYMLGNIQVAQPVPANVEPMFDPRDLTDLTTLMGFSRRPVPEGLVRAQQLFDQKGILQGTDGNYYHVLNHPVTQATATPELVADLRTQGQAADQALSVAKHLTQAIADMPEYAMGPGEQYKRQVVAFLNSNGIAVPQGWLQTQKGYEIQKEAYTLLMNQLQGALGHGTEQQLGIAGHTIPTAEMPKGAALELMNSSVIPALWRTTKRASDLLPRAPEYFRDQTTAQNTIENWNAANPLENFASAMTGRPPGQFVAQPGGGGQQPPASPRYTISPSGAITRTR